MPQFGVANETDFLRTLAMFRGSPRDLSSQKTVRYVSPSDSGGRDCENLHGTDQPITIGSREVARRERDYESNYRSGSDAANDPEPAQRLRFRVWLAILGEWGTIGWGLLAMFGSPMLLSLALAPSMLLVLPSVYFGERGLMTLVYVFTLLGSLYVIAVMTVWNGGVLYFFASRSDASSFLPSVLWSYGVALGPWQYMARQEAQGGGGDASAITTFFAQIGYVVMIVLVIFAPVSLVQVVTTFVAIMLVGLVFQFSAAVQAMRFQRLVGGHP